MAKRPRPAEDNRPLQATGTDLRLAGDHFEVPPGGGSAAETGRLSLAEAVVLETFLDPVKPTQAVARAVRALQKPKASALAAVDTWFSPDQSWTFRLRIGGFSSIAPAHHNLLEASRRTQQILRAVGSLTPRMPARLPTSTAAVGRIVRQLREQGFLAPPPGSLDFGDLRRLRPLCPAFGMSRGKIVDRYYLDQFLAHIRPLVTGRVLEVGGNTANRERYAFHSAETYEAMELKPAPGVTHVGDVLNEATFAPAQFDSILLFNVLEHVPAPAVAVANAQYWLKPGGRLFVVVPGAQRAHRFPSDYWRFQPDGFALLLQDFAERELKLYGNPLTAVASLLGATCEDLTPAELDARHPDYVVACCAVARKGT